VRRPDYNFAPMPQIRAPGAGEARPAGPRFERFAGVDFRCDAAVGY
jgi:hypothetical protein